MRNKNYLKWEYFINKIYQYHLQNPSLMSKEKLYNDIREGHFIDEFSEITSKVSWKYFTPIVVEIFMNNLTEIKNMVDKGYDFNEEVKDGLIPLMIATYLGRKEIIEYLYSLDTSVRNKKDDFGRNLLMFACSAKNVEFVQQLVGQVDINSVDSNGLSAMHYNLSSCIKPVYIELIDTAIPGFIESTFREKNMGLRDIIDAEYNICKILVDNKIDLSGVNPIGSINFYWPYRHLDKIINLLLQNGCSSEFERNELTQFEEGEYSFSKLFEDIKDLDVSEWIDYPFDSLNFIKFEHLIKKHKLTVVDFELQYSEFREKTLNKVRISYENGVKKKSK